jgi:hypothetical protein
LSSQATFQAALVGHAKRLPSCFHHTEIYVDHIVERHPFNQVSGHSARVAIVFGKRFRVSLAISSARVIVEATRSGNFTCLFGDWTRAIKAILKTSNCTLDLTRVSWKIKIYKAKARRPFLDSGSRIG